MANALNINDKLVVLDLDSLGHVFTQDGNGKIITDTVHLSGQDYTQFYTRDESGKVTAISQWLVQPGTVGDYLGITNTDGDSILWAQGDETNTITIGDQ